MNIKSQRVYTVSPGQQVKIEAGDTDGNKIIRF